MSKKSPKIAEFLAGCQVPGLDPHYLGYFRCFNRQLYYEAHDVLEELWLRDRKGTNDGFYKGLIQLAGAFVHLQKNRLGPAAALFRLSSGYLGRYPAFHAGISVSGVLGELGVWLRRVEAGDGQNPWGLHAPPILPEPIPESRAE